MAKKGTAARRNKTDLVLIGGAKPKMRRASRRDWTKAKEQSYVNALAETCNYTAAAAAAGVSVSGARERRKTNAAFRASCREAVGSAYQCLELAMLERSLIGTEREITRRDGSVERFREYPNAVALTLLRMHRETAQEAASEQDPSEIEEARERLFQKLERLRKKMDSEGQDSA